jgi:hypothetical protein
VTLQGLFWNYVSVGMDARAAHNFHALREAHPAAAASRMANQFWYSFFSCTSGACEDAMVHVRCCFCAHKASSQSPIAASWRCGIAGSLPWNQVQSSMAPRLD